MWQSSRFFVLFLTYFITARISLNIDAIGGFAGFVWPAAGIALAALFLWGYKLWPAIFAAALLVNFLNGASLPAAIGIGIGNTLEGLSGAYLLRKITKFNHSLERLKDALSLIYISILIPVIAATFGSLSLFFSGSISWHIFEQFWFTWWVGDLLGILIVAPLILVWSKSESLSLKKVKENTIYEVVILLSILVINCLIIFQGLFGIDSTKFPITQTIYPVLIWFSIRLNPKISFLAIFLVSTIAIWSTVTGTGPFIRERYPESLLYLQGFLATIAITFTILTAVMAERRRFQSLKDEFISAASHELKTPITTLKAYAQLISSRVGKNNQEKPDRKSIGIGIYVSRMEDQINRVTSLIYELLDVSRIESGKMQLSKEVFKVSDLLKDISRDYKITINTHKVIYKSPNDIVLNADRFRISQVLINLISNAIKFSPKADKVIVTAKKESNSVIFSVKDFGVGIDPKYHQEIFSRFFQTEQDLSVNSAGLGLGLYISAEIVKQHSGKIWLKSQKSKGSTFYFKLPLKN